MKPYNGYKFSSHRKHHNCYRSLPTYNLLPRTERTGLVMESPPTEIDYLDFLDNSAEIVDKAFRYNLPDILHLVRLCMAKTPQKIHQLEGIPMSFSLDGNSIAVMRKNKETLQIYNAKNKQDRIIPTNVTGGNNIYNPWTNAINFIPLMHQVFKITYNLENQLVAIFGRYDTRDSVTIWTWSGENFIRLDKEIPINYQDLDDLVFSNNGKQLAISKWSHVRIYDLFSEHELRLLSLDGMSTSVSFSPDDQYLAVGDFKLGLTIFDLQNNLSLSLPQYNGIVSVSYDPHGHILLVQNTDNTRLLNSVTYQPISAAIETGNVTITYTYMPSLFNLDGSKFAVTIDSIESNPRYRTQVWELYDPKVLLELSKYPFFMWFLTHIHEPTKSLHEENETLKEQFNERMIQKYGVKNTQYPIPIDLITVYSLLSNDAKKTLNTCFSLKI